MVERLYPGVYVTEIASHAQPIDGVPTSTAPLASRLAPEQIAHSATPPAPAWTQHDTHDPGITLVQLFAYLGESLLFRAGDHGVAQGLAVVSQDASGAEVHVSPGQATDPRGQPVEAESTSHRHHIKKP